MGQLQGNHVHKLSGSYVGELYKDMILDMAQGNPGNIGNPGNPEIRGTPAIPEIVGKSTTVTLMSFTNSASN